MRNNGLLISILYHEFPNNVVEYLECLQLLLLGSSRAMEIYGALGANMSLKCISIEILDDILMNFVYKVGISLISHHLK